jgi:hypothetical protein
MNFMLSLAARLSESLSTGSPLPFFSSSLTSTYVLSLRDIVLKLIIGIPNNKYTVWCSWENALVAYRDTYDTNTLVVTLMPRGFWDTPLPQHTIKDSDSDLDLDGNGSGSTMGMQPFPIKDDNVIQIHLERFRDLLIFPRSGSM